jgi:hypothetical protein
MRSSTVQVTALHLVVLSKLVVAWLLFSLYFVLASVASFDVASHLYFLASSNDLVQQMQASIPNNRIGLTLILLPALLVLLITAVHTTLSRYYYDADGNFLSSSPLNEIEIDLLGDQVLDWQQLSRTKALRQRSLAPQKFRIHESRVRN